MTEVADVPIQIVIGKLKELAPALRAAGVKRLSLFGSRARGDARPDSDLDVLIERTSAAKVLRRKMHPGVQVMIDLRVRRQ